MVPTRRSLERFVLVWLAIVLTLSAFAFAIFGRDLGPLSSHMLQHTVSMTMLAPVLAVALAHALSQIDWSPFLVAATASQVALLWGWHAPGVFEMAHHSSALTLSMHVTLVCAALLFWIAVVRSTSNAPWKGILALLLSGKFFCLLGALLIFSERTWYGAAHGHGGHQQISLDDQHMAGLIMVAACPATYIAVAVAITANWLASLTPGPVDAPQ